MAEQTPESKMVNEAGDAVPKGVNEPIAEGASRKPTVTRNGNEVKGGTDDEQSVDKKKGPPALKKQWDKLGLDALTLMTMAKGACGPVIGLALFQYPPFAATFPTIGYLVAIAATLSMPILPRAKFIQTMIINILGIAVGACIALLCCYCAVQARLHTSVPILSTEIGASGASQATQYNSSASAVAGIWLFFNILFANALRFSRPQLQTPVILYSIFANISGTFAPLFGSMTQSIAFVKLLLQAFLSGFAISTVVHFVVFPFSCRQAFTRQSAGYMKLIQGILMQQKAYLAVMERADMLEIPKQSNDPKDKKNQMEPKSKVEAAAGALRATLAPLVALHSKIRADMSFVKSEIAFGKLDGKDLDEVSQHFRSMLLPLLGLASVADIFTRVTNSRGWTKPVDDSGTESEHKLDSGEKPTGSLREQAEWNEIMRALHQPFEDVTNAIIEALDHASYVLEFTKSPNNKSKGSVKAKKEPTDEEAAAVKKPGDDKFAKDLEDRLRGFNETRKAALRTWCSQRGISLDDVPTTSDEASRKALGDNADSSNRRQLYLILYMEFLLSSTAKSVLNLVKFADQKVEDGTMKKTRLILPGRRRLMKWAKSLFDAGDASSDQSPDSAEAGVASVALGDAFHKRKDPEHLPPANFFQTFGDRIRKVSQVLCRHEVAFGFRVACATMSIAIIAYLEQTQEFFVEQRLVWAMIMVAIGMTMTTGSGVFGFLGRVFGTFVAMCTSLVIWYIAGGRGIPGAVLPVLWVFCFLEMYVMVKQPRFVVISIITIVTQILILGYELQADKIGVEAVSANGQRYYPIYELAPYRLATVASGCAVAFIWTYFPFPITARTALRRQLGETIYLLANYYSCVHTTIQMRISDSGGDPKDKKSPTRKLEKARGKVLVKILGMLTQLRMHADFIPFEMTLGGKFPKSTYDKMILKTQHLLDYTALLDFSTRSWDTDSSQWAQDLRRLTSNLEIASHEIISLLTLISSSMTNAYPLPPYLKPPKPYQLTEQINQEDDDILSLHHVLEPGYAAFAVTQVATRLVDDDLRELLKHTRDLVGEVDFSFHIYSTTTDSSQATLATQTSLKGKRD